MEYQSCAYPSMVRVCHSEKDFLENCGKRVVRTATEVSLSCLLQFSELKQTNKPMPRASYLSLQRKK